LYLPPYTNQYKRFLDIAVKVCPKLKEEISHIIGEELWKQGNKDIRDVISLGKLILKDDGPEEIEGLVVLMTQRISALNITLFRQMKRNHLDNGPNEHGLGVYDSLMNI
jgi:hypothetical protein